MGGKKEKKKSRDPEKKAALAAKKEAKADKAALKRLAKEQDRLSSLSLHESDREDVTDVKTGVAAGARSDQSLNENIDSLLESYRNKTKELAAAEFEPIEGVFPSPPRGNFTWTLCPSMVCFIW